MATRHPPDPGDGVLDVDASALPADAISVDALARLALYARRAGRDARLCGASADLGALLSFLGLAEALGLRLQSQRQAEQREQAIGVEKRVDRDDDAA